MKDEFLGDHLARAADAAQRRPRLGPPAADRQARSAEPRSRGLESIDRNVRLQAQLTADLLDVSKALTGKLRLDPRPGAARRGGDAGGDGGDAGGARRRTCSIDAGAAGAPASSSTGIRRGCGRSPGSCSPTRSSSRRAAASSRSRSTRSDEDARLIVRDSGRASIRRSCRASSTASRRRIRRRRAAPAGSASGSRWCASWWSCTAARSRRATATTAAARSSWRASRCSRVEACSGRRAAAIAARGRHGNASAARRPARAGARPGSRRARAAADGAAAARRDRCRRSARSPTRSSALEAWRPDVLVSDSLSPDHDFYALVGKVQSLESRARRTHPGGGADQRRAHRRAAARPCWPTCSATCPSRSSRRVLTAEIARLTGRERRRAAAVASDDERSSTIAACRAASSCNRTAARTRGCGRRPASAVDVVLDGGEARDRPLEREADGHYSAYRWPDRRGRPLLVPPGRRPAAPDPCSRFQPTARTGRRRSSTRRASAGPTRGWHGVGRDGQVVYEMHVGTFTPEGTWRAAAEPAAGPRASSASPSSR